VIIYSVFILIIFIILSLFFIEVDEVVKVQGIVKTQENISVVKNIASGKVLQINYDSGSVVQSGDLLYKIDDSVLMSQLETEMKFLKQNENELMVYEGILNLLNGNDFQNNKIPEEVLLKYNSYLSSVNKIKKEIEINENYYNDEILKPINLSSKISVRDKKAKLDYLKLGLIEYKINFKNEIIEKIKSYKKIYLDSNTKINNLLLEIEKTNIYAPVTGIVQELQNFNVGDYLFSSQEILKIIPATENLYKVHLYLNPSDVAKITEGLQVKLRFPAFPFYEYNASCNQKLAYNKCVGFCFHIRCRFVRN
jgi:multidrug resistance efflux pump